MTRHVRKKHLQELRQAVASPGEDPMDSFNIYTYEPAAAATSVEVISKSLV